MGVFIWNSRKAAPGEKAKFKWGPTTALESYTWVVYTVFQLKKNNSFLEKIYIRAATNYIRTAINFHTYYLRFNQNSLYVSLNETR